MNKINKTIKVWFEPWSDFVNDTTSTMILRYPHWIETSEVYKLKLMSLKVKF